MTDFGSADSMCTKLYLILCSNKGHHVLSKPSMACFITLPKMVFAVGSSYSVFRGDLRGFQFFPVSEDRDVFGLQTV